MPSPPLTYEQLHQAATEAVEQVTETLDTKTERFPRYRNHPQRRPDIGSARDPASSQPPVPSRDRHSQCHDSIGTDPSHPLAIPNGVSLSTEDIGFTES